MAAKPRHLTVCKEIDRMMSNLHWTPKSDVDDTSTSFADGFKFRRRPNRPLVPHVDGYFQKDPAGKVSLEVYFVLTSDRPCISIDYFGLGFDYIGYMVIETEKAVWDPTTDFYQSVKKSIELKREQQELARACRRLPEGIEKSKPRRL